MEKRIHKGALAVAIAAALTIAGRHELGAEPAVDNSPNAVRQALGSLRRGRPRKFRGPSRAMT